MTVRGTPAENAAKWRDRLSSATPQIQAGIARVQVAPGQQAAAQVENWANNTLAKKEKWRRNVSRVSLEDWRKSATDGVTRVAQGAQAKVGKMESFLSEFQPHIERVQAQVNQMPRGNLDQNLARMVANARGMATFKRGGGV